MTQSKGIHKTLDELFTCGNCDKLFTRQQCHGSLDNDLLALFTNDRLCIKCINKNRRAVLK